MALESALVLTCLSPAAAVERPCSATLQAARESNRRAANVSTAVPSPAVPSPAEGPTVIQAIRAEASTGVEAQTSVDVSPAIALPALPTQHLCTSRS